MTVTYTLQAPFAGTSDPGITRTNEDGTISSIPLAAENTDYQAYLAWVAEGNTPNPYVTPPEPAPLTPAEKLAAAGLSVDELKELLGIK